MSKTMDRVSELFDAGLKKYQIWEELKDTVDHGLLRRALQRAPTVFPRDHCSSWLFDLLSKQSTRVSRILKEGIAEGFSRMTIYRAARMLKVKKKGRTWSI